MMARLIASLMTTLDKHDMIPEGEQDVYQYSLEVAFNAAVFWVMMIGLTLAFGRVLETVFYLGAFFFLRSAIGGYHASTHLCCLTLSAVLYLVFIGCCVLLKDVWLLTLLCCGAVTLGIVWCAPVDHPNKPFGSTERQHYRQQSLLRVCIFLFFEIAVIAIGYKEMAFCAVFGAIQAVVFMLIAYYLQTKEGIYESSIG